MVKDKTGRLIAGRAPKAAALKSRADSPAKMGGHEVVKRNGVERRNTEWRVGTSRADSSLFLSSRTFSAVFC